MADLSKDTLLFAAEQRRMCKSFGRCTGCPLIYRNCTISFPHEDISNDKRILDVVQQWHDEHPLKTYAQDFFTKFPNACKYPSGTPCACRNNIYGNGRCSHKCNCKDCWNEPMSEDNL